MNILYHRGDRRVVFVQTTSMEYEWLHCASCYLPAHSFQSTSTALPSHSSGYAKHDESTMPQLFGGGYMLGQCG